MTKNKKPTGIKVKSGEIIPVRLQKKNIRSWRLLLLTKPPKNIKVRKIHMNKLVFD